MAGPAYSVVMTAYRTEQVVGRAVASVLAQTDDDWELVVVDNGPSEAMVAALRPFLGDPRVHLVRQQNRGQSGGIAAAAAAARGDWFVVLNSDDALEPGFLATMRATAGLYPDVAAVTCDAVCFDGTTGAELGSYLDRAGQVGPVDVARPLRLADVVDGPTPYYCGAVRREVWEATGGMVSLREDTTLVNDLDFWLRLLTDGHVVRTVPDRLGRYRIESGSVSRPGDDAAADVHDDQLEAAMGRAVERAAPAEVPDARAALDRFRARRGFERSVRAGRAALREGSTADARAHFAAAWRARRTARVGAVLLVLRTVPAAAPLAQRLKRALGEGRARGSHPEDAEPGR